MVFAQALANFNRHGQALGLLTQHWAVVCSVWLWFER
jgi:hypothetical protein